MTFSANPDASMTTLKSDRRILRFFPFNANASSSVPLAQQVEERKLQADVSEQPMSRLKNEKCFK